VWINFMWWQLMFCGCCLWNLLYITLLAPRIFKCLEICAPLDSTVSHLARNNSIQQSPYCEANISSATQEMIDTSWNPRVSYLQAPLMSKIHSIRTPTPCYYFKINLNIIRA
jgi:hypothetical protein